MSWIKKGGRNGEEDQELVKREMKREFLMGEKRELKDRKKEMKRKDTKKKIRKKRKKRRKKTRRPTVFHGSSPFLRDGGKTFHSRITRKIRHFQMDGQTHG